MSLNNDTFWIEVKGLFEANVETQLFQEDIGKEKKIEDQRVGSDWTCSWQPNQTKVWGCLGQRLGKG